MPLAISDQTALSRELPQPKFAPPTKMRAAANAGSSTMKVEPAARASVSTLSSSSGSATP
jgi:hypothetical protein